MFASLPIPTTLSILRNVLSACCLLLMLAPIGPVLAADAKPAPAARGNAVEAITVESDRMLYDDRQRINTFKGNVVLVRGDIEIRADELVLRQNAKGEQTAVATGRPATFVQRRAGAGEIAEGEGIEMRYNNSTQELVILGGARLQRQRVGQAPDMVRGARIVYQSANDFFTVDGGKAGGSDSQSQGRVRVVIQPRSQVNDKTRPGATPGNTGKPAADTDTDSGSTPGSNAADPRSSANPVALTPAMALPAQQRRDP